MKTRLPLKFIFALLLAIVAVTRGDAQTQLAPMAHLQFFDNSGVPLASGKLCTYAAGTTTPQATYSDQGLTTPLSNPIILNSAGRPSSNGTTETNVYLSAVSYKFVLLTAGSDSTCSTGTTLWTADNVPGGLSASVIVAGTIGTARLGSGAASANTFLRGDSTWSTPCTVVTSTATGTQNNFNPGIVGPCTIVRMNNATTTTINGFIAGFDGQRIGVYSVGAGEVDFAHANAGSTSGQRLQNLVTSGVTALSPGVGYAEYVFDGTASPTVWRLVTHEQGAPITFSPTFGATTGTWTMGTVQTTKYYLKGRVATISFSVISTSTSSATTALTFTVPFTSVGQWLTVFRGVENTTEYRCLVFTNGSSVIQIQRGDGGNWSLLAGQLSVQGQIAIEVL